MWEVYSDVRKFYFWFSLGPKIGLLPREREKRQDVKLLLFPTLNKLNVGLIINKPTIELALQICMSKMSSMFNQVFLAVVWRLYK